jgi:hypothetical protein
MLLSAQQHVKNVIGTVKAYAACDADGASRYMRVFHLRCTLKYTRLQLCGSSTCFTGLTASQPLCKLHMHGQQSAATQAHRKQAAVAAVATEWAHLAWCSLLVCGPPPG